MATAVSWDISESTMARRLFTVEDTFMVRGRGLVLVPGIVPQGDERFRVGDAIQKKLPDETSRFCNIDGLERITGTSRVDVVVLLRELTKEDVPIGTEVWSVDRATQASA
jgi:translation elongation factor EF-Tu-like GTPase